MKQLFLCLCCCSILASTAPTISIAAAPIVNNTETATSTNRITIRATGEGNSFSPVPLPDGRLLFVTDRADNLDLAIWTPNHSVSLWETHPADDSAPILLKDGKTIVFLSDRGERHHLWWQRQLIGASAHALQKNPTRPLQRYRVAHPFDSNGDGISNSLDLSWIVDSQTQQPVTPLSISAMDPIVDQHGTLWFTILKHGVRRIAFIADPSAAITVDNQLASWQQWRLLQGFRNHVSSMEQTDLLWDIGIDHAPARPKQNTASSIQRQWQKIRAALYTSSPEQNKQNEQNEQHEQKASKAITLLKHAHRIHATYSQRMHYDLANWLKTVGRGTDALQQLQHISDPFLQQRAALLRAELLIDAGHAKTALLELLQADSVKSGFMPIFRPEIKTLSQRGLRYLSTQQHQLDAIDVLRQLYDVQTSKNSNYLHSIWQLRLITLYLQRGAYEAGLQLCSQAIHPSLSEAQNQLRLQLLYRAADEKLHRGQKTEALALTRQALLLDMHNAHVARLHFAIASTLHRTAPESLWWQRHSQNTSTKPQPRLNSERPSSERPSAEQPVSEQPNPEQQYIEALILTYKNQPEQAKKLLLGVVKAQPKLWVAQQTLGWLLEQDNNIKGQRQALQLYKTAYELARHQHENKRDIMMIRSNLINLSFKLKRYHQQLRLMQTWRSEKTQLPIRFLMQAANACFKLSRPKDGLLWLDLLPDSLNTAQRNRSLRLRALLADQSGAYHVSVRALSLLIADPELDASLRMRLLLNRALAYIHMQNMSAAQQDLKHIARLPPSNDPTGWLRIDGEKMPFDVAWVASSLQAEMHSQQQSWLAVVTSLKQKRDHHAPARLQAIIHQNLAIAYIRQGLWLQAQKQLTLAATFAEKQLPTHRSKLFDQILWLQIRLAVALGQPIRTADLNLLASHAQDHPQRALEIEMVKLSQFNLAPAVDNKPSLQTSMHATRLMRQRMNDWKQLRHKATTLNPSLSAWVDFQYYQWLSHYSADDMLQTVRAQLLSNPSIDPWLTWWFESGLQAKHDDSHRLATLIATTHAVLPMHESMLQHYYQNMAASLLQQQKSNQALTALFEGERNFTKLRHQAVKSRPLSFCSNVDCLRRDLRSDEAMMLIWPASSEKENTDLWWMDHENMIYKHVKKGSAKDWYAAIQMWQHNKKRLFLSFVNPTLDDFTAFKQVAHEDIIVSPTLLHAAAIGRLYSNQSGRNPSGLNPSNRNQFQLKPDLWKEQLWQQADASLLGWQWNLQQGIVAYRQQQWEHAIAFFSKALSAIPTHRKTKLLMLIGKAAIRGGLETRALALFEHAATTSATTEHMRLRLQAATLSQQGKPVAASTIWLQLYHQSKRWRDISVAANALITLTLQGIIPVQQADQIMDRALATLPAKKLTMQLSLQINRMRLITHMHQKGGWKAFQHAYQSASNILQQKPNQSRTLEIELLFIEASWQYQHYHGLQTSLEKLNRDMPEQHPLRFNFFNLKALILQSMGEVEAARQSFASARHALIWINAASVNERLAGWHNNVGRLELVAGNMPSALAHFHAAIDIDSRRGDRIGLLYDRKNLGRLLVQSTPHDRAEGIVLLQRGLSDARQMKIPKLEVAFLFALLSIGETDAAQDSQYIKRFATLIQQHHYESMHWQLAWLKAVRLIQTDQHSEAIAMLKQSIAAMRTAHVNFDQADPLFSPRRPFEDLIDLLFDTQPEQALVLASQLHRSILANRFKTPNAADTVEHHALNKIAQHRVRLIYLTGSKKTWCWLLTSHGIKSKRLAIGSSALQQLVKHLNQRISKRTPIEHAAKRLTEKIWLPLQDWLPQEKADSVTNLDVLAIGPLEKLSFAALYDGKDWLIKSYAFAYPLTVFSTNSAENAAQNMALFSYAGEFDSSLTSPPSSPPNSPPDSSKPASPLILATNELDAVRDFSPIAARKFPNVSKAEFLHQSTSYDWIHIASHINVIPGQARFSYLSLKPATSSDGKVHVHELLTKDWHQKTIVLSGCGSENGENPFGQALLLAGAQQTVTNIWSGNDLSISILMKAFYRQLYEQAKPPHHPHIKQQRTRKAPQIQPTIQAIHTAQRWMQIRYPDPVDWAGLKLEYR